jgi:hypothetical protein
MMIRFLIATLVSSSLFLSVGCGSDPQQSPDQPPPNQLSDPATCGSTQLPRVIVRGNQLGVVCHGSEVPVRLKGINRSGLQHKSSLGNAGFPSNPQDELHRFRSEWNAVAVRLPIAQDYYMGSASYRDDIGNIVSATQNEGQYLILEVHGYSYNLNPPLPDGQTSVLWDQLARRFGRESHVLFDLWNEPRASSWDVWKTQAESLIKTIRSAGAQDTVVVVGGLDYAYDLSALADANNRISSGLGPIIYATHPYPFKGTPPHVEPDWDRYFGNVSRDVPVILGEYGVDEMIMDAQAARDWMARLHRYIDGKGLSALAWSVGDMPHLVLGTNGSGVVLPSNPPDPSRPTDPFGIAVKAWMK